MSYRVITAVTTEPVTLAQAKLHLRVETATEDALITALITAAREAAEHYANRALAEQTLEAVYDEFPHPQCLPLPFGPAFTITSVKYDDAAGVEQTLSPALYTLSLYGSATTINLALNAEWPVTKDAADAVRVRYVAGSTACPKAAYAAMLLIIGHLYANREDTGMQALKEIPMGARSLLDTVKVWG